MFDTSKWYAKIFATKCFEMDSCRVSNTPILAKTGVGHSQIGIVCLRFGGRFCTGGRNVPQIWGRLLPGGWKRALDSVQTFPRGAETCLRFGTDFCTGGRNVSQIQGRLYPVGISCPRFSSYFTPVGEIMPEFRFEQVQFIRD